MACEQALIVTCALSLGNGKSSCATRSSLQVVLLGSVADSESEEKSSASFFFPDFPRFRLSTISHYSTKTFFASIAFSLSLKLFSPQKLYPRKMTTDPATEPKLSEFVGDAKADEDDDDMDSLGEREREEEEEGDEEEEEGGSIRFVPFQSTETFAHSPSPLIRSYRLNSITTRVRSI